MQSRLTDRGVAIAGVDIVRLFTATKSAALALALLMTLVLRYHDVFQEETLKFEFFPLIQDSITKFYPIRSMYQIFAALVSLFSAVLYTFIWSAITGKSASLGLSTGLLSLVRTVSFITFSCVSFEDGPNAHTNAFALYCVSTLAWIHTIQSKLITRDTKLNGQRRRLRDAYLGSMVLCTIFFYRHQVKQVKYAYSLCSIFQWAMMAIDVVFDHLFAKELRDVALHVDFPLLDKRHIV